jgi:hypothetical protein
MLAQRLVRESVQLRRQNGAQLGRGMHGVTENLFEESVMWLRR